MIDRKLPLGAAHRRADELDDRLTRLKSEVTEKDFILDALKGQVGGSFDVGPSAPPPRALAALRGAQDLDQMDAGRQSRPWLCRQGVPPVTDFLTKSERRSVMAVAVVMTGFGGTLAWGIWATIGVCGIALFVELLIHEAADRVIRAIDVLIDEVRWRRPPQ